MPIYEFACPKCRVIFSFLSKRISPERLPVCPKCGNKKLNKQMSPFATPRSAKTAESDSGPMGAEPSLDDPKVMRAMAELERDMAHLDENDPRDMAKVMKKMKEALPPGTMPKELDAAIQRLQAGEDPEQIEADMGEIFGEPTGGQNTGRGGTPYRRDTNLYEY